QIRYFSSGMKQRLKLVQAFFSNTPVLLLDEPTTNLDQEGVNLYMELIKEYSKNRLVIISSNTRQEYEFADECIKMEDYK
ncbi:MAG TPA: ATP-binding cassette domain-containing protein, partial [Ferruginibacter sp.]|nr:ATP-binding cassette domain-containing protein [Ferruginibacter sp.]